MSANIAKMAKVTRIFFLRAENTRDKYGKNSKFNKILDLERQETKKVPEMSVNIAKIAKVTRIFLAS